MWTSPLSKATAAWAHDQLARPTLAQTLALPHVAAGRSVLLAAPTGSGKTLAAFLAILDRIGRETGGPGPGHVRALYISPLKALAVDIERNLRAPLAGIAQYAERLGEAMHVPTVGIRTGDTPAQERARMVRRPPDILVTTPESLYLLLTSDAVRTLGRVETVIVDEIHALVPTKRGAHLFLSLERLEAVRRRAQSDAPALQRIGLSATQRPLDEVARLLGGFDGGEPRPVTVVDAHEKRPIELTLRLPDLTAAGGTTPTVAGGTAPSSTRPSDDGMGGNALWGAAPSVSTRGGSVWPETHRCIVEAMRDARTTMVFVNSRRLAERVAAGINEVAGEEVALAHHGSVSRDQRVDIEERLKRGELPAIVATSSLELGIDIGAVDHVIQVEAPPSVAAGLQRIGRACHHVGGTPRGTILAKHRADLLAAATVALRMREGWVEATYYPRNPLDVLAQQLVAIAAGEPIHIDALYNLVQRAAPFAELPRKSFDGVLDMLCGRYPSDEFAELRPRLHWDRLSGVVTARQGAKRTAILNGGTIPDRGLYGVYLASDSASADASAPQPRSGGKRVGELDEEMVFELREGEVFVLGASAWRAVEITHDRVLVTPAAGERGKMPFWHGDRPGRPRELGEAMGALLRQLGSQSDANAEKQLTDAHATDGNAAARLLAYVREQQAAVPELPTDRTLVVERFPDELGDWRICILSPLGARVHAPWATAVKARLQSSHPGDVEAVWSDDGIAFRMPASDAPPDLSMFFPASTEIEGLVTDAVGDTPLFAARFRENAARALLLPKRDPRRRTPLWAQRKRSADLLAVARRHPAFPIVLETYREVLRDVFDVPALVELLRGVEQRRIHVAVADTRAPSPFSASLLFSFVANFIYDGDAPPAERRLHALSIDVAQLRELLGEAELRELLDDDVVRVHEERLQRLHVGVRHIDALHDLLLALGDLTADEVALRSGDGATLGAAREHGGPSLLEDLIGARRGVALTIAGEVRYVAIEEVGRYRDALGCVPPPGVPAAFLEPVPDARLGLLRRFARTRGPFTQRDVEVRFALDSHATAVVLKALVEAGTLVEGAFRKGVTAREYCDRNVLETLRRASLAKLRKAVEPVRSTTYAAFVPLWQGLDRSRAGADGLLGVLSQLEGCPILASTLETEVLPARVAHYRPWDLDALCMSGQVVWAGVEPLGSHDGRIALYLAEHEALLARSVGAPNATPAHEAIVGVLERRGAIFFHELVRTLGGYPQELAQALWDLVWSGHVVNDTLEPLRSLRRAARGGRSERGGAARAGRMRRSPVGFPSGAALRAAGGLRSAGPTALLPGTEGRWSLRSSRLEPTPTETERRAAMAQSLLERYGIVTKAVPQAEAITGGFAAVYEVLKRMGDAGRVRRGYFVAGAGGAQFALPGAEERLRRLRTDVDGPTDSVDGRTDAVDGPTDPADGTAPLVIAASDPAQLYGAVLPWPDTRGGQRPQRVGGARVVLCRGELVAYLSRSADALLTFFEGSEDVHSTRSDQVARALVAHAQREGRRALLLRSIDGAASLTHPMNHALRRQGFVASADGLVWRASARRNDDGGPDAARRPDDGDAGLDGADAALGDDLDRAAAGLFPKEGPT